MLATQIYIFPHPKLPPTRPTVSSHPRSAVSCIVDICFLMPPTCPTAPPYYTTLPSYPAPSAMQPPYLPTQRTLLLILTNPSTMAILPFTLFFWVVGKCRYGFMKYVRYLPFINIEIWPLRLLVRTVGSTMRDWFPVAACSFANS